MPSLEAQIKQIAKNIEKIETQIEDSADSLYRLRLELQTIKFADKRENE